MSYREFFVSKNFSFGGQGVDYDKANYIILGIPFDATSTYRRGSKMAPSAIREASLNIETYSFRYGIDLAELDVCDIGDLDVSGDVGETLRRIELVTAEISSDDKIVLLLGGEHTITLGSVKGFSREFALIDFDAHLDSRDKYADQSFCHATVIRRINELVKPRKIVSVGTRAACIEEVKYCRENGIHFITCHDIVQNGIDEASQQILDSVNGIENLYLTLDMDILDPAFAPAVQNPEPAGLSIESLLEIIRRICDDRIMALDVVEVAPQYDKGITAITAAKIIFELLSSIEKS